MKLGKLFVYIHKVFRSLLCYESCVQSNELSVGTHGQMVATAKPISVA